jgi:hypothetical protein
MSLAEFDLVSTKAGLIYDGLAATGGCPGDKA